MLKLDRALTLRLLPLAAGATEPVMILGWGMSEPDNRGGACYGDSGGPAEVHTSLPDCRTFIYDTARGVSAPS